MAVGQAPLACAAGAHFLGRIADGSLPQAAAASGDTLATALAAISAPGVTVTVRGRGLMLGAHIAAPGGAAFAKRVAARMRESGVLALRGGADGQVVKLTPPLTLPSDMAREAIQAIEAAVRDEAARHEAAAS
jgi:4-aminobutyrate aminotransferase-like enzyme